ncbi:amnionless domain-containing protein [Ditylenchus destructor]|nr:amnionless domain-containing protein [Ditylenchus destructor]
MSIKTICVIVIFIASRPQPNKIWLAEASEHILDPVIAYRATPNGIGRIFQWKHSNNIEDRNNWLNGDVVCDGDWVHMERDNNPTVIMFAGGSLKANVIDLPTDGVMFFSNERKVVLGEKDKWQCNKRKSSEDVYFQLMNAQPNFYDAKNWLVFEKEAIYNCNSATECNQPNTNSRLDAEQVPGQWVC